VAPFGISAARILRYDSQHIISDGVTRAHHSIRQRFAVYRHAAQRSPPAICILFLYLFYRGARSTVRSPLLDNRATRLPFITSHCCVQLFLLLLALRIDAILALSLPLALRGPATRHFARTCHQLSLASLFPLVTSGTALLLALSRAGKRTSLRHTHCYALHICCSHTRLDAALRGFRSLHACRYFLTFRNDWREDGTSHAPQARLASSY